MAITIARKPMAMDSAIEGNVYDTEYGLVGTIRF